MTLAQSSHRWFSLAPICAGFAGLTLAPGAFAAPQTWGAAVSSGAEDTVTGVAADGSGGTFESGRSSGDLGGPQLGQGDAFMTRRDAGGNVLWTRKIATVNADEARGVASDGAGGVFLAGNLDGEANSQTVKDYEAFVARYDGAGNQVWQRAVGVAQWEQLTSCAPDGSGGVFVGGQSFVDETAATYNDGDIWLSRFDADGNQLWIRRFGGSETDVCARVENDGSDGALLCGWTFGSLGGPIQGLSDAWFARYDGAGTQQWVRQLGSTSSLYPTITIPPNTFAFGMAPDGAGGSYVTGSTNAELVQGASIRQQTYVLRLDAQGNTLWLNQFGDTGAESAVDLVPDGQGGAFLAGVTYADYVVTSAGLNDGWIRRMDASGTFQPALQFGSKNDESVTEIALVGTSVVVAGMTRGLDDLFGVPPDFENGYVAKFDACEFGSETNYCSSTKNSTGWASHIGSTGSPLVSNNDFGLFANLLPLSQPGVFLMGTATNQMPFGNGTLCVGGSVFRLPVDEILFSYQDAQLDMTDATSPASQIAPGSTWHFQFWYRDAAGTGAGFNLSDALTVTFCP